MKQIDSEKKLDRLKIDKLLKTIYSNHTTEEINFISNHEMGTKNYEAITNKDEVINKGLDMAYDYVLSNEYSLRNLING